MIQKLVFILITVTLFGCQNVVRPEKPNDLIRKDKMVAVIYDAYLANAAKSINNKKLRQMGIKLDSIIYLKHDIDSLQFAKSNEYYSLDLDNYADIFSKVEARFLSQQEELDSIKQEKRDKNRKKNKKTIKSKEPLSKDPAKLDSVIQKKRRSLIDPIQSEEVPDSIE